MVKQNLKQASKVARDIVKELQESTFSTTTENHIRFKENLIQEQKNLISLASMHFDIGEKEIGIELMRKATAIDVNAPLPKQDRLNDLDDVDEQSFHAEDDDDDDEDEDEDFESGDDNEDEEEESVNDHDNDAKLVGDNMEHSEDNAENETAIKGTDSVVGDSNILCDIDSEALLNSKLPDTQKLVDALEQMSAKNKAKV